MNWGYCAPIITIILYNPICCHQMIVPELGSIVWARLASPPLIWCVPLILTDRDSELSQDFPPGGLVSCHCCSDAGHVYVPSCWKGASWKLMHADHIAFRLHLPFELSTTRLYLRLSLCHSVFFNLCPSLSLGIVFIQA